MQRTLAIAIILLISGCAAAPVQEMSDARQAIRAAKQAGAEEKTPSVYSSAEQDLVTAQIALHRGEYSRARHRALKAREKAVLARELSIGDKIPFE